MQKFNWREWEWEERIKGLSWKLNPLSVYTQLRACLSHGDSPVIIVFHCIIPVFIMIYVFIILNNITCFDYYYNFLIYVSK